MVSLSQFQEAIRKEHLAGWLFSNYKHRDSLSDRLLEIPAEQVNTRPWYYLIPRGGDPVKIVHIIEDEALSHLPGRNIRYGSLDDIKKILTPESLLPAEIVSGMPNFPLAMQFSPTLPVLSYTDYGTVLLMKEAGYTPVSSEVLIQRVVSLLNAEELESHCRAANHLYEIVEECWTFLRRIYPERAVREGEVQDRILEEFRRRDLITDHPPIVSAGSNTGNPHYAPSGDNPGKTLAPGDIVQFDLWAKEKGETSIYADISWVGKWGGKPSSRESEIFQAVKGGRDRAVRFISQNSSATGFLVDREVRAYFAGTGHAELLKHRTGHGIDREVHGWGVNLDSLEFPDHRPILEGSCFSVEPGLYTDDFGMRTEINICIVNGVPRISGKTPQESILLV